MTWGQWGEYPPCEHLLELRDWLIAHGMTIWGEFTEGPNGWVNVHCDRCQRTYETTLTPHANGEWTDEDLEDD